MCHIPVSPAYDICDVHDDFLRPFDQDAEERKFREEMEQSADITYDGEVELEGESAEAQRPQVVTDPGKPTLRK